MTKIVREDSVCVLSQIERIKRMEQRFNHVLAAIEDGSADSLKAVKEDVAELSKYYSSELWKQDFAADERQRALAEASEQVQSGDETSGIVGIFPPDLKRGVLSEDDIWNLLSDYYDITG
jgi:hypothetical protein